MTYDPTWIRKSPILIPQAVHNEALIAQKGSVRLDALDWGQKVGSTTLDADQQASTAIAMTPLNNNKMFVVWGAATDGRYTILNSDGIMDSTAYQVFEAGNFLDYGNGLATILLPNGNVVVAYGQDQGASNALVFKIFSENGDLIQDAVTVKTHATETQWGVGLAALPDGQFIISWEEFAAGAHSYFAIYDSEGYVVKSYTSLGGQKGFPQPAPLSDGNWIVTYGTVANGLRYQTYDRQGIQIVGETLFRSGVAQAAGVRTMANGQIVIPFQRGFGLIDRQGNVVVAPEPKEAGVGNYSVTVLPHDNIVTQYNTGTSAFYKIYDSAGNLLNTQVTYATDASTIAAGDVATFKNGNFMLAYVTAASILKIFIHEGTKAGFAGDLNVQGAFGLSIGTTVNEISIDGTLAGDSDDVLITEKAAKTYVDAQVGSTNYRIFDGNSEVSVFNDVSDNTSHINLQIDGAVLGQITEDGLTLGPGIAVNNTRNDFQMGGYDGAVGSQTALTTEYAVRKYVDDINEAQVEPTGFVNGNLGSYTTIGIDGSNSVFVEPYSGGIGSYDIFFTGQRYRKVAKESVVLSDVEGLHYVYFDVADGVLKETTTFNINLLYTHVYVLVCYWDATNKEILYFGDERHGCTMDGKTHINIHLSRGTLYQSGLALADITADGTGSLNVEAQFSTGNGLIIDEDISHAIPAFTFPANVNMWYLDGAATWRRDLADDFAVVNTGSGRVAWNKDTAGTWSLEEATDGYFVLTHIYATNDYVDSQMIGIVGQAEYATIALAQAGAADEINSLTHGVMPFAELHPVATLIFETQDAFSNTPKAIIRTNDEGAEWTDWRTSGLSPGSGSVSDHGSLSGLGNDDHLQYFRVDGTRAVTGNLNVNGTTTLGGTVLITAATTISVGGLSITGGTLGLAFGTTINEFSIDGTLVGNSDDAVPTEQAVKTYVDTAIANLNPDKIWANDSSVEVIDDGTNAGIVEVTTDAVVRGTWAANGLTLQSGTNINEFSIDGTLAGDSDNALPTEKAVKTYVDAQIGQQSHKIFQGDSYIQVIDTDGTAQAYAEVVINGTQVQYWDDAASTIRMGKASGAGRVEVNDTTVIASIGASDVLSLTGTSQTLGIAGDTRFTLNQSTDEFEMYLATTKVASGTATGQTWGVQSDARVVTLQSSGLVRIHTGTTQRALFSDTQVYIGGASGTRIDMNPTSHTLDMYVSTSQIFAGTATSQTLGVAADSRLVLNQTANTADLYAGAVQVIAATETSQIFGVAGDSRLTLDQSADTFTLNAGGSTIVSGGLLTLTLGVGGDTTIVLNQTDDQIAITAGGQSQILVETSGTTIYDDLTITGDIFVDGTTFVVHQTEVKTADNMITVNYGEPGAGVTSGRAGIEVDRGTLDSYYFVFSEATDTFRVGSSPDGTSFTNLQAVATREDVPTSMTVPWWNASEYRFDTAGSSSIGINTSTDVITITAGASVSTFEADGLTLANGTNINEFSIDGTLAGDSDDAIPTEKAVKTYVDAQIFSGGHLISQGNSYVEVHDDNTSAGWIEVVADGVQVQYWDAQAASIRMGKASGAGRVTVTDTVVTAHIGAAEVMNLNSNTQTFGATASGGVWLRTVNSTNTMSAFANSTEVMTLTDTNQTIGRVVDTSISLAGGTNTITMTNGGTTTFTSTDNVQTLGVAGDTNIDLDQSTDTALINVGGVEVFNATPDLQTVGGADSYITIDQTSGSIIVGVNSVEAMTLDGNGLQLFTGGATINEFSTDGTLADDSDTAVPTEKAVKTYIDAAVAGLDLTKIYEGDSYVHVVDDGTALGYVTIVTDGVEVGYYDAAASSQRIGKTAGGHLTTTDTGVTGYVGATDYLILTANTQQLGNAAGGERIILSSTGNSVQAIAGGVDLLNLTTSTQRFGNSTDTNITMVQASDSITFNAAGGAVGNFNASGLQLASGERVNSISLSAALGTSNTTLVTQGAVKSYADTGDTNTYNAAIAYADGTTLVTANTYTDVEIASLRNELDLINMRTVTADTTAVNGDVILVDTTAGDVNVEMQELEDARIIIKKKTTDGNRVNISVSSGTIDGQNLIIIDTPYQSFTFVSDGSNFYII